jgi:hypothetical protein
MACRLSSAVRCAKGRVVLLRTITGCGQGTKDRPQSTDCCSTDAPNNLSRPEAGMHPKRALIVRAGRGGSRRVRLS